MEELPEPTVSTLVTRGSGWSATTAEAAEGGGSLPMGSGEAVPLALTCLAGGSGGGADVAGDTVVGLARLALPAVEEA